MLVLLFLFALIKKKKEFLLVAILFITGAVLFKTDFLVELGIGLYFPIEAKFHCFLVFLGRFSFLS